MLTTDEDTSAMDGSHCDNFDFDFDLDEYFEPPAVPALRNNPFLLKRAALAAAAGYDPYEKAAIIPAGGDPAAGGDPSMGGAPPPDPSMGGGAPPPGGPPPGGAPAPPPDPAAGGGPAPMDPALIQAVAQAVMQQLGGGGMGGGAMGGGMGGPGDMMGKPKKVDPAIIDAKLYDLDKKVSLMCDKMGITIPASQTLGLPPDPMAAQAADQDSQNVSAAMGGGAQPPPGPPGIQPMGGMDAGSGPIGKAAVYGDFGDPWPVEFDDDRPLSALAAAYGPPPSMAARFRRLLGD